MPASRLLDVLGPWRRRIRTHRRPLAAACAAASVLVAIHAARPDPGPTATVLVATETLRSGSRLGPGEVEQVAVPTDLAPAEALSSLEEAHGRVVAAPVPDGAVLTRFSVVGPGLLEGYRRGTALVSVRLADPATVTPVRVGDSVDVVGTDPRGSAPPRVLARRAQVAALPAAEGDDRAVLVLAVDATTARTLSGAGVSWHLSVTVVV
ncbi:SAF domain-containing protein [Mumia sp. zg.B53]|uniref:SAF domain-containing protein n=1 Tax=unclassified Mumia TaxID=2621872 RepID=UPI001C6DF615|nr:MULTISPECIES: SAF domain-containing protein [unclassified Mumia]MBW9206960.1 SAF domain-containing protein [Mumia sp. zg.B17]MBW9210707.1 SAF domain-containing protein [Mumia sp. zg.B21]MBW9215321.1 SAF domain-containing protein [Mumia sp. zg.B53]MDD9349204.1 SAF domain-containing protein [Mumia sp.]